MANKPVKETPVKKTGCQHKFEVVKRVGLDMAVKTVSQCSKCGEKKEKIK